MTDRIIPITDTRRARPLPEPGKAGAAAGPLADARGRHLHDLRISVTDRCNFRCTYCMPKEVFDKDYAYLPHGALLSFEEITRLARIFAGRGVQKIRLTGGEPLLRKNIEKLIEMLAAIPGIDLTLTTNGSLLQKKARDLKNAGLNRVTVSLDAIDDATFKAMNDADYPVADVLAGIDAAAAAGFSPVKVNMVVKRGANDHAILPMARHFRGSGHILRFIEFMDVGASNGWRMDDVVPSAQVLAMINAEAPLVVADANYGGEVAERWRYADGSGEIGVISSVTQAFCSSCTRLRLSTEGMVYTCLFATEGYDLRSLLRNRETGADDQTIDKAIRGIWRARNDNYSEVRTADTARDSKIEMSYIGG